MKLFTRTAALTAILALSASPAFSQGPPAGTPKAGDNPGAAHKLAAPGRYCKDASKQHVEGQKGTPFSACVKGQARLRSGKTESPRAACKEASKKHVDGQKGTPFSTCVKAGAKLLKDMKAQSA